MNEYYIVYRGNDNFMTLNIVGYSSIEALKPDYKHKPNRNYSNLVKKIDLRPSINLAYVLGAIMGDGAVFKSSTNQYIIEFNVVDKPFSDSVKSAMESIGLHCWRKLYPRKGLNEKPQWYIIAQSKMFYDFYNRVNLKSFTDTRDKQIAFIRGFYEAEGSYCTKVNKKSFGKRISLWNKNIQLLETVKNFLMQLDFHPTRIYRNKRGYGHVCLNRSKEVHRFLKTINPCIKHGEKRRNNGNKETNKCQY